MKPSRTLVPFLVGAAAALMPLLAGGPALPPGFADESLLTTSSATGVSRPTAMAYEPGSGDLWITEQGPGSASSTARVRVWNRTIETVGTALSLSGVDSRGERGILGIAFDPDYLEPGGAQRYVYLYVTRRLESLAECDGVASSCSRNRVSRFLENGGVLGNEEMLFEAPPLTGATNHNGGAIEFGVDGTLFIAIGDNDTDGTVNPLSRDLGDPRGKILRINADGSVPGDNPFVGQPGVLQEIWAWGVRNPFRISVDPRLGVPILADVGEGTWEAAYVGVSGADYGYPCVEGRASFRTCNPSPAAGTVHDPTLVYGHGNQTPPIAGSTIIGGTVYSGDAFPARYHDRFFFSDHYRTWIRYGRINDDLQLVDIDTFATSGASGVIDMAVSPAGCLGWLSRSSGAHEICHDGTVNGPPQALAETDTVAGLAPLDVSFTGSNSADPDGETLAYQWDLDDGTMPVVADPEHTYTVNGVYEPRLTVDDLQLEANSTDVSPPLRIVVGNRAPTPTITAPAAGSYNAGDGFDFSGSVTDLEDTLGAGALSWTVVLHHGADRRPILGPVRGATSGSFTIPTTGLDATDVFYRVTLRAEDLGTPLGASGVVAATTHVDLVPNVSRLTLSTVPPGLGLELDGESVDTPEGRDSVVGFQRTVDAPSPQQVGGRTYSFAGWSDGGDARHEVNVPVSDSILSARFACVADCPREELVTSFSGGLGSYGYVDGEGWRVLPTGTAPILAVGDLNGNGVDDLVTAPAGGGVAVYYDDTVSTPLVGLQPVLAASGDSDGNGSDEVMFYFGPGTGTYVYENNSTWRFLTGLPVEEIVAADLDGGGREDFLFDFGPGVGLYVLYNGTTWQSLTGSSPESMRTGDLDGNGFADVVVDLGVGAGVYVWFNDTSWSFLTGLDPEAMAIGDLDAGGLDELVLDLGGLGLWVFSDNATWSRLASLDAGVMTILRLDDNETRDLAVDFGPGLGLYLYSNTASWSFLTNNAVASLAAADFGPASTLKVRGPAPGGDSAYRSRQSPAEAGR